MSGRLFASAADLERELIELQARHAKAPPAERILITADYRERHADWLRSMGKEPRR